MSDTLTTERLLIEKLSPGDSEFILALLNTPGWLKFIGDRNIKTLSDAEAYVQRTIDSPTIQYWVVKKAADSTPAGVVSFIKKDYLDHHDIGYAFHPDFSNLGYAYEAVKAVLEELSKNPLYPVILATVAPDNEPSIRLLEKLGLKREHQLEVEGRTLLLFSLVNLR
ncbi:GNAT family N-acetyltransferase [Pedobacter sp. HMWF019]|uniref:GNAT family N-acetyltransferase n=1 Tax=Pedobacter sp. HMWF019 TaxID=2056856 RepID=UPI000D35A8D4|nr:GNAT family N-acetyltransferase [Pedobacter sp. HMWF019]PTS99642.1 GNAT family N-acetyltransferase [Pedobacter sp. HMWF019]